MKSPAAEKWLRAMQLGQQLFQRGMVGQALHHFSIATRISPGMAEGWVNLGAAQIETGKLEEAIGSLKRATGLNPGLMPAHLALGDAFRLTGKLDESISAYDKAVTLQKTPEGLNKLGGALRLAHRREEAEALYRDALRISPEFSLARVNLATIQLELERFDQAGRHLQALRDLPLPPNEREELDSANAALQQYLRVEPAVEKALRENDLSELHKALLATPESQLQVDEEIIDSILPYAEKAKDLPESTGEEGLQLPGEWPLIEALFMIPYVKSVSEYRSVREQLSSGGPPEGDLLESTKMEAAVIASGEVRHELGDPVKAEMHLRYWHALATDGVANTFPGQFKMTSNEVYGSEYRRKARPHLVTGTIRHFFREIYSRLPQGLPRGLVTMMAISDIHPFADGNGRIAQMYLNRELVWTGQAPVLFTRDLGIAGGEFTRATRKVRLNKGSFSDVVTVIQRGQQFARDFCAGLIAG